MEERAAHRALLGLMTQEEKAVLLATAVASSRIQSLVSALVGKVVS